MVVVGRGVDWCTDADYTFGDPPVGGSSLEFEVEIDKEAQLFGAGLDVPCKVMIDTITLEGPADTDWESAFLAFTD